MAYQFYFSDQIKVKIFTNLIKVNDLKFSKLRNNFLV